MSFKATLRDAVIVVLASGVLALGANAVRSNNKLPWVAQKEYEILVPCPEYEGQAKAIAPDKLNQKGTLLVDAREQSEFKRWHPPGAVSVPFDYLEPTPKQTVSRLLKLNPRRAVVYGDGENPDSGEQLANELAGRGMRNVFFVKGGAPLLQRTLSEECK